VFIRAIDIKSDKKISVIKTKRPIGAHEESNRHVEIVKEVSEREKERESGENGAFCS
jgi:hypothetical protein